MNERQQRIEALRAESERLPDGTLRCRVAVHGVIIPDPPQPKPEDEEEDEHGPDADQS